jgi:serine/threonine protein kinase
MAPVVLRDVNVFTKKNQVGQGTYGIVFVGQDKATNEIVALKRINTEQEENGFPITAIREVKILKALHHVNIVTLKEIVTSKGALSFFDIFVCRLRWKMTLSLLVGNSLFRASLHFHELARSSSLPR